MKKSEAREFLHIWTVYDHPTDQPDCYVARLWIIGDGQIKSSNDMFTADTLDELRRLLPPGLNRLDRFDQDDPKIVEVWL
jgi:hypothetical protein